MNQFFNPFCEQLAKTIGRGKCEESDCALGQMFVDDSNKKPELLPCWLSARLKKEKRIKRLI
jgi:hypothetical protein